jgi:hypothetical protein
MSLIFIILIPYLLSKLYIYSDYSSDFMEDFPKKRFLNFFTIH